MGHSFNVKAETTKPLNKKGGGGILQLRFRQIFFCQDPQSTNHESNKLIKWTYEKLKLLFIKRLTGRTLNKQAIWEKIVTTYMSDTGLVSRINKQLLRLNDKKTNQLILKSS